MTTRTYYIGEVSGQYNNTHDFKIEPFVGYLVDSEGYTTVSNYNQCKDRIKFAKKFEKPVSFLMKDISNPWYFKVEKLRWVKVTETFDVKEEYV